MGNKIIICTLTCEQTDEIVEYLMKKRLIACANIIHGVNAKYWWKGKIESATENMVFMETKAELVRVTIEEIKVIHSYETPKIISLDIEDGLKAYMSWINSETTTPQL